MEKRHIILNTDSVNNLYKLLTEGFEEDKFFDGPVNYFRTGQDQYIIYGEKYYYRSKSRILATIVINESEQKECRINIILGGGSQGFTMTLGAETNMLDKITKRIRLIADKKSWTMREVKGEKRTERKGGDHEERNEEERKTIGPL